MNIMKSQKKTIKCHTVPKKRGVPKSKTEKKNQNPKRSSREKPGLKGQRIAVSTAQCSIILIRCNVEEEIAKLKNKLRENKETSARAMVPWLPRKAEFEIPPLPKHARSK